MHKVLLIVLAVAAALAVVPAATAQGPTIAQLTDAGWTCMDARPVAPRIICSNPAHGFPTPPPDPNGRPSYSHFVFGLDGTFRGTTHLIRGDLYRGQPCGSEGSYFFIAPIGYFRCDHF